MTNETTTGTKSSDEHPRPNPLSMLPIRMVSRVIRGYGRGSTDLGIPTANLDLVQLRVAYHVPEPSLSVTSTVQQSPLLETIPCGIYWGYGRVVMMDDTTDNEETAVPYTAAISIGYNPTYGNTHKTVEPHLIAPEDDPRRHASSTGETILRDFYEQPIRLSVVGYLRPELPFEGLDKLIVAIKNDIETAVRLASSEETTASDEREWVQSDRPLD